MDSRLQEFVVVELERAFVAQMQAVVVEFERAFVGRLPRCFESAVIRGVFSRVFDADCCKEVSVGA